MYVLSKGYLLIYSKDTWLQLNIAAVIEQYKQEERQSVSEW